MKLTEKKFMPNNQQQDHQILHMLDRGIDDIESGRELPLDDAFRKITEIRNIRKNVSL